MSKRTREAECFHSVKRCRVHRKRDLDEEERFTQRKRVRIEEQVLEEAVHAVQMPTQDSLNALRQENAYLRHMLGRVARIGFSLKEQRDILKCAYERLRTRPSVPMMHHAITVP